MPRSKNLVPNLAAFLDLIAFSEGTTKFGNDDGYNVLVGGTLFTSYKQHPSKLINLPNLGIKSSAAGRYQIMARYYKHYAELLMLPDFGPISQDTMAIQFIKEQTALKLVVNGNIKEAINKCANIWASFPGAGYGQHEHKLETLLSKYEEFGGKLNVGV